MPVTDTDVELTFTDVVVDTPISVGIPTYDKTWIKVKYGAGDLDATYGVDYVVSWDDDLDPDYSFFYVTPQASLMTKIAADGTNTISVRRELPLTTDFDTIDAATRLRVTQEFEKTLYRIQQIDHAASGVIALAPTLNTAVLAAQAAQAAAEAAQAAAETAETNAAASEAAAAASASAASASASAAASSASAAATSASAAATSASNAATSASSASTSASTATTQATNASNSASAASTSATNASNSASAASTSATNASNSASAAATSASNASTSETNAAASAAAAAASAASLTYATTTETLTGTETAKIVSPDDLAALWEHGGTVASAGTVTLGEGGYFHISGTTTITDIDFAVPKDGRMAWLIFDGALTLTHNGTTLAIPGNSNITTAAGDRCLIVQDSGDNIRVLAYFKNGVIPLTAASTTAVLTGTATSSYTRPDDIAALWEKGSNVASAATVSLGDGGLFHITGTTGITDIDFATAKDGREALLVFDSGLTVTHNATTLRIQGDASYTFFAGDMALVVQDSGDNVLLYPLPMGIRRYNGGGRPITGCIIANDGTDATNDIGIAAGECVDDTGAVIMRTSATQTKQLDAAWAVGSAAGGRDTGSIANGTWHVWRIMRPDTGVVDHLFSLSATSPTMPTGYTYKRRIGSIVRASGAIKSFRQDAANPNRFKWATHVTNYSSTSARSMANLALTVPTGIETYPIMEYRISCSGGTSVMLSKDGDGFSAEMYVAYPPSGGSVNVPIEGVFKANTSGEIGLWVSIFSGTIGSCSLRTAGWYDYRDQG